MLAGQCTVYRARGRIEQVAPRLDPIAPCRPSLGTPLQTIMTREVVCARPDLEIAVVIHLIIGNHLGCLPVVDERRHPIGIITKYDLVEQLDAAMQLAVASRSLPTDLTARIAEDVMMPLAFALGTHATIAHACALMNTDDLHHVLVTDPEGALVGVVSSKDIVRWVTDATSVREYQEG